jgi:hypothetical protein
MVVRVDATEIVSGDQCTIGTDDHVVQVIANWQQLAECRLVEACFVLTHG